MITTVLLYMVLAVLTVFLLITMYNFITAPMLGTDPATIDKAQPQSTTGHIFYMQPRVSVLVPARNEEKNIANCLSGLLAQTYPNIEIVVLNDNSTDNTGAILEEFVAQYPQIKVLQGKPLPTGWTGKNWACQQLSAAATGNILLFTDADNTCVTTAVERTVQWMQKYDLSVISTFPQQITITTPEQMVVPVIDMFVYSGLPLWLTYLSPYPSLAAANGQWIAFTRQAYTELGGHLSVRNHVVEDVELSRATKQRGLRLLTTAGTDTVFCRMYDSFNGVWEGFTKNMFGLVGYSTLGFLGLFAMLFSTCILPYGLVWFEEYRWLSLAAIVANMVMRLLLSIKYKHPVATSVFLHPFAVALTLAIGVNSFVKIKQGKIRWKDRSIDTKSLSNPTQSAAQATMSLPSV